MTERESDPQPIEETTAEEIDPEAVVADDRPGADLGEAYDRASDEDDGADGLADADGPRVTDAYRSGS